VSVEQAPAEGGRLRGRVLDLVFVRGRVEEVRPAARRMRHVRISGVPGLAWTPGQQVRVNVSDLFAARTWLRGMRDALRTYSVWDYDPDAGALELRVMDHDGDGPGARWARTLRPGQEVAFTKPEGGFTLREDAPYHLFAGEETASVAFGAMLRALPADAGVYGVVEVAGPEDELALPRRADLTWRHRGDASAASSASLVEAVRSLELPDGPPGVAYVAGEARTVQLVRAHLVRERGWPRRAVRVKPFWTPGKRGLD
jgi:NADPH-dependent ferric siderophore reductase